MFDHKHYVPILKTKAGERWAIDRLYPTATAGLTPLFEIHQHKDKLIAAHADDICEDLASVWGTGRPLFLDCCWVQPANGDATTLDAVFQSARDNGLLAIPAVRPTFGPAALDVIGDILVEDSRAYMLRVSQSEALEPTIIDVPTNYLALPRTDVHFLVDYRTHAMDLANDIPQLPNLNDWRTLTAASGSFPRSLSQLPLNTWHDIPRHDWTSWLGGVTSGLARRPSFGDYATRDPGAPAGGGKPSVNLRYTNDQVWRVRVARQFQLGFAGDMQPICASLVASGHFSGPRFSAADEIVEAVAQGTASTGAPQSWVQWGVNHHLSFVVDQIQRTPGL